MSSPVTISLHDPWDRVPVGVMVPLRFTVTRPPEASCGVEIAAGGVVHPTATVNAELLLQDLTLMPSETASVSVGVRFDTCGAADAAGFELLLRVPNENMRRVSVPLPAHPFRVVPALDRALAVSVERVCGYDDGVKVEVAATNTADTDLTDVELLIEPADAVRAGPLKRIERNMASGQTVRFESVVTGGEMTLAFAAGIQGERVEARRTFSVPSEGDSRGGTPPPYTFLEPRMLTTDRVTILPEGKSAELVPARGVFPVRGGKRRYLLTVEPSHPNATSVRVYPAPGQVEVEKVPSADRRWPFVLTVVENPTLTQVVRLDYDVQVEATPLRGEVYLSIRPTHAKAWAIAATAGAALTAKGGAAVFGSVMKSDGTLTDLLSGDWSDLIGKSGWELVQLGCIPIIRGVLWVADLLWRPLQEG